MQCTSTKFLPNIVGQTTNLKLSFLPWNPSVYVDCLESNQMLRRWTFLVTKRGETCVRGRKGEGGKMRSGEVVRGKEGGTRKAPKEEE